MKKFTPGFGLKNRHAQTLYSAFFRKLPNLELEVQKHSLSDGDFLECHWRNRPANNSTTPIIILFHGLAGSYKSPYVQGLMSESAKAGFASVLMHFRGCSGKENLLPRSYHSGESGDALSWINAVVKRYPNSKIFGVGYSLGGNMLLKLLGELGDKSPLSAAVSVSAPLQLDTCADAMDRGFSKFYQRILLKNLNLSLERKFNKHDMRRYVKIEKKDIKNLKTFWDFDGAYTAPVHGFSSALDYYEKCSSKRFLKYIQTPTLIIHSYDDPFMTTKIIPNPSELSDKIILELSTHGGHVGFISGTALKPVYWLEKRVTEYFRSFI